jgi:imidazoleglycerol-phosphate dehydratase
MKRTALVERKTAETEIRIELALEGGTDSVISTPVPFLDHMLDLFAFHSGFSLVVKASGDTEIDDHHTVEDLGIALGQALRQALGDRAGIARYGYFMLPMDETLATVALDISGRAFYRYSGPEIRGKSGAFDTELVHEFMRAFAAHAGLTLHVQIHYGDNLHHILEAIFKALARSLRSAVARSGSLVPSSKGSLD